MILLLGGVTCYALGFLPLCPMHTTKFRGQAVRSLSLIEIRSAAEMHDTFRKWVVSTERTPSGAHLNGFPFT